MVHCGPYALFFTCVGTKAPERHTDHGPTSIGGGGYGQCAVGAHSPPPFSRVDGHVQAPHPILVCAGWPWSRSATTPRRPLTPPSRAASTAPVSRTSLRARGGPLPAAQQTSPPPPPGRSRPPGCGRRACTIVCESWRFEGPVFSGSVL
jgi:hypothetical protein